MATSKGFPKLGNKSSTYQGLCLIVEFGALGAAVLIFVSGLLLRFKVREYEKP